MATMAEVREHADAMLADALRAAEAGRRSAVSEAIELGFIMVMISTAACREAVAGADDVATVLKHLRWLDDAIGGLDAIVTRHLDAARRSTGFAIRQDGDRRQRRRRRAWR